MKNSSNRWSAIFDALMVLLLLVSAVFTITEAREVFPLLYAESEGVVQNFIMAVERHDYELVHRYLDRRLQDNCSLDYLRQTLEAEEQQRVLKIDVLEVYPLGADTLDVKVRITATDMNSPFYVNEWTRIEKFTLTQELGFWRISEVPWPLSWCPAW